MSIYFFPIGLCDFFSASPKAVATIETLLLEREKELTKLGKSRFMTQHHHQNSEEESADKENARIKESGGGARACGFCGKLFASRAFLDKHLARRHGGQQPPQPQQQPYEVVKVKHQPLGHQAKDQSHSTGAGANDGGLASVLEEHQASLRHLAHEEAAKIKHLYEQLHVENSLAEEMKLSRLAAQQR